MPQIGSAFPLWEMIAELETARMAEVNRDRVVLNRPHPEKCRISERTLQNELRVQSSSFLDSQNSHRGDTAGEEYLMKRNPLLDLADLGQSVWLDFLSRGLIASGELQRLISQDGVKGVTSNPSILEEAVAGSDDYDSAIAALIKSGQSPESIYETVAVDDVRQAADLLRPVYERLEGADGYASLEVSPHLAYDTAATLTQARQFWKALDRPNVMIKVPATRAGLPAISQLTAEGINVNVTLIFGLTRYREVVQCYLDGLMARAKAGKPLARIASVASFFLSRIDTLTDDLLNNGPYHRTDFGEARRGGSRTGRYRKRQGGVSDLSRTIRERAL